MDLVILEDSVGGVPVVTPVGEVDRGTVNILRAGVAGAVGGAPRALLLDLSRLRFMDSTGVHVVLDVQEAMDEHDGHLAVVTGNRVVDEVFALTGANATVQLYPDQDSALQALAARVLRPH